MTPGSPPSESTLLSRVKRWYKRRWLRVVFPNWSLFRENERAIAEAAFDEVWFSAYYPWYLVGVIGVPALVVWPLLGLATAGQPSLAGLVAILLAPVVGVLLVLGCDLLVMLAIRSRLQRTIWGALRQQGYDVCLGCGYWLAGIPSSTERCPECGAARPGSPCSA